MNGDHQRLEYGNLQFNESHANTMRIAQSGVDAGRQRPDHATSRSAE
jgi:hypothetical protein